MAITATCVRSTDEALVYRLVGFGALTLANATLVAAAVGQMAALLATTVANAAASQRLFGIDTTAAGTYFASNPSVAYIEMMVRLAVTATDDQWRVAQAFNAGTNLTDIQVDRAGADATGEAYLHLRLRTTYDTVVGGQMIVAGQ